jgi:hypothetical protein
MTFAGILVTAAVAELVTSSPWPHFRALVWGVLLLIALGLALIGFLTPREPKKPIVRPNGGGSYPSYGHVDKVVEGAEKAAKGGDGGAVRPG